MKKIVVAGNSHMRALGVPLKTADGCNSLIKIAHPSHEVLAATGQWPRAGKYWRFVMDVAWPSDVVLMWRGNKHLARFLLAEKQPFDFVLPTHQHLPLNRDAVIVPVSLIEQHVDDNMEAMVGIVSALVGKGSQVLVCSTPPPKGDDEFLKGVISREQYFHSLVEESGGEVQLTDPVLRFKLWSVMQSQYEKAAKTAGAQFLPAPAEALDASGLLRREFWADDVSHANKRYGRILIEKFVDHFTALGKRVHA